MNLTKTTDDGLFKIVIVTQVTEEMPLLPNDLNNLAMTLDELAVRIRQLALASQIMAPGVVQ